MGPIRTALVALALFTSASDAAARPRRTAASKPALAKRPPPTTSKQSTVVKKSPPAIPAKPKPPLWLEVCNQLAPATSVLCSLAPLPTIFEAARAKSVGDLPLLPYSSMAANGLVWALYGWLTDSAPVKYANVAGTLLGTYYFTKFKKYSPPGASGLPGSINQHLLVLTWIVFANAFILANFSKSDAAEIVGKEGVLMYIILFASPLAAVKNVIATRSAASIPLPFTIASTINCSLWSVAGLLHMKDFYIYFPSMMGLACAVAQIILKGMYGEGGGMDAETIQEMGKLT